LSYPEKMKNKERKGYLLALQWSYDKAHNGGSFILAKDIKEEMNRVKNEAGSPDEEPTEAAAFRKGQAYEMRRLADRLEAATLANALRKEASDLENDN